VLDWRLAHGLHMSQGRILRSLTVVLPLLAGGLGVSLCRAQEDPSPAATVMSLAGSVSVMRDSMPWALRVGDSVRPTQLIVTGPDGLAEFRVSDGSTFQVFPNSRVIFRMNPTSWGDLLDLFIGRIKVHIQKLGNQPNPNKVTTPTAVISVRGTVFDVAVDGDTETTFVSVDEGQVDVATRTVPSPKVILNPGESISVVKNVPLAKSVDKGSVMHGAMRAAAEAIYQLILRGQPGVGGGSSGAGVPGTGGGTSGDKPKPDPPTTTPPPAAPAPPTTLPPAPPPPPAK